MLWIELFFLPSQNTKQYVAVLAWNTLYFLPNAAKALKERINVDIIPINMSLNFSFIDSVEALWKGSTGNPVPQSCLHLSNAASTSSASVWLNQGTRYWQLWFLDRKPRCLMMSTYMPRSLINYFPLELCNSKIEVMYFLMQQDILMSGPFIHLEVCSARAKLIMYFSLFGGI